MAKEHGWGRSGRRAYLRRLDAENFLYRLTAGRAGAGIPTVSMGRDLILVLYNTRYTCQE